MIVMVYYLGVKPYIEMTDLALETCNEGAFFLMTYFILLFSDWTSDYLTKTKIGWAFNGLIGLQILVNFAWLIIKLIRE
jgi:hypothetical protein